MTFGGPLWKRQAPTHVVEGATAVWAVRNSHLRNTGLVFVGVAFSCALAQGRATEPKHLSICCRVTAHVIAGDVRCHQAEIRATVFGCMSNSFTSSEQRQEADAA